MLRVQFKPNCVGLSAFSLVLLLRKRHRIQQSADIGDNSLILWRLWHGSLIDSLSKTFDKFLHFELIVEEELRVIDARRTPYEKGLQSCKLILNFVHLFRHNVGLT